MYRTIIKHLLLLLINLAMVGKSYSTIFTVTDTTDIFSGKTLRWAINEANKISGADTIEFAISMPYTFTLKNPLPDIKDQVYINGYSQVGSKKATDTSNATILIKIKKSIIFSSTVFYGLRFINGSEFSKVTGLSIFGFKKGTGILIETNHITVEGNHIGVGFVYTNAYGNTTAITILDASSCTIGGTTPAQRNVISSNDSVGVLIIGLNSSSNNNKIQGNYIGTSVSGNNPLPNKYGIIIINSAKNNLIGGRTSGTRNIISGNTIGVAIYGIGADSNLLHNNYIGLDATGTYKIHNNIGVGIDGGASYNLIGGSSKRERNIISGNDTTGIHIVGIGTKYNKVQGNYIGTDPKGTAKIPNTFGVVIALKAKENSIGGINTGEGNLISGNGVANIALASGANKNTVQSNLIGTDSSGSTQVDHFTTLIGILIFNASNNRIGERNIISNYNFAGIGIGGKNSWANEINNNLIGINKPAVSSILNYGLYITGRAFGNTIINNRITNNNQDGIYYTATATTVLRDTFNTWLLESLATTTTTIIDTSLGNRIIENSIYNNGGLGIDLGKNGVTPNDSLDEDTGSNALQNYPIITKAYSCDSANVIINGYLNSTPNTSFRIDFFSNKDLDSSDYGEGEKFHLAIIKITDSNGKTFFSVTIPIDSLAGNYITTSATDTTKYNTSEFSKAIKIRFRPPSLTNINNPSYCKRDPMSPIIVPPSSDNTINREITWYTDSLLKNIHQKGDTLDSLYNRTFTYYVTQTVNECESNPTPVTITIYDQSSVDAGEDLAICKKGESQKLEARGGTSYYWSTGDLTNTTTVSPETTTTYHVTITTPKGCTFTDSVTVFVGDIEKCLHIYNAFSPDGDDNNDTWIIEGIEGTNNTVTIFNRWGDKINSFTNYNNADIVWDGKTINGMDAITGTYFYVIEFNDKQYNGWVQVTK